MAVLGTQWRGLDCFIGYSMVLNTHELGGLDLLYP